MGGGATTLALRCLAHRSDNGRRQTEAVGGNRQIGGAGTARGGTPARAVHHAGNFTGTGGISHSCRRRDFAVRPERSSTPLARALDRWCARAVRWNLRAHALGSSAGRRGFAPSERTGSVKRRRRDDTAAARERFPYRRRTRYARKGIDPCDAVTVDARRATIDLVRHPSPDGSGPLTRDRPCGGHRGDPAQRLRQHGGRHGSTL